MNWPNLIGLVGAAATIGEYALVSTGVWSARQPRYQIANIISTAMILYSLLFAWNLPSAVAQIVWILLSLVGLLRTLRARRRAA